MDRQVKSDAPLLVEVPIVAAEVVRQMVQLGQLGGSQADRARVGRRAHHCEALRPGIFERTARRLARGHRPARSRGSAACRTLLIDNDGALVIGRDEATQTAWLHPAFADFCRDFGVEARVCRPYRARTKGKTESGVKYIKRNAITGRAFGSFAEFEGHLDGWMREADERVHGTTHERPIERLRQAP